MPVLHSSSSGTNESSPRAMVMNPAFERYIGIDYSGAQTQLALWVKDCRKRHKALQNCTDL